MSHLTFAELQGLGLSTAEEQARWDAMSTPRDTVDQVNAQNEPIERVIDQSYTSISLPGIASRPQRVSPLAQSWGFPTAVQYSTPGALGESKLPWVLGAVGVVLVGVALYTALSE